MIGIRAEAPDDKAAIRHVNQMAFEGGEEAVLVDAIRQSSSYVPELSLVAEADRLVVGHVLFSGIAIESSSGSMAALALAPLAVLPAWQRQGIGSALVRQGLARSRDMGHGIVVVVGDPGYYERFGFRPARQQGLECTLPVPDEAFMALALQAGALDSVRGTVVYPPAFSGL